MRDEGSVSSACRTISTGLLFLITACGDQEREWSEADTRAIYQASFVALHEALDEPARLFADPRPRFLVEEEGGVFRMGDFNRYGDPALSAAIELSPLVSSCEFHPERGCMRDSYPQFLEVSEILPLSPRDAGVIATHLDSGPVSTGAKGFVLSLRAADDEWRVVRVDRATSAQLRR